MNSNEECTDCSARGILIGPTGQCHECYQDMLDRNGEHDEGPLDRSYEIQYNHACGYSD